MQTVCIYCGSSPGLNPAYLQAATALGRAMAERGLTIVYGGAHVGLMGAVADAGLAAGGRVIGVIPEFLRDRELAHTGLSELRIVASMHERKTLMAELADGFIALPGGLGTFEELFEMLTWAQLGFHAKPIGVLNTQGFYSPLFTLLETAAANGFMGKGQPHLHRAAEPQALLDPMLGQI